MNNTITVRFHVIRDTPSEVQAQARLLIIDALVHYATCRKALNTKDDVVLVTEILNTDVEHDPPADDGAGQLRRAMTDLRKTLKSPK